MHWIRNIWIKLKEWRKQRPATLLWESRKRNARGMRKDQAWVWDTVQTICLNVPRIFHSIHSYSIYPLHKVCLEILECLKVGRKNSQTYSEVIRSFAITFHFYSPRAYKFVREKFNKHLPNETTIRKWYANCTYENEPGISKEGMRALASLAHDFKNEGKQLIVSIAFDEMSIRRLVQWSDAKKKFMGYITHGKFDNDIPVARNALVFLLTAINADFSLPIAHYFVIALNAAERASLLTEIITGITKIGVRVATKYYIRWAPSKSISMWSLASIL